MQKLLLAGGLGPLQNTLLGPPQRAHPPMHLPHHPHPTHYTTRPSGHLRLLFRQVSQTFQVEDRMGCCQGTLLQKIRSEDLQGGEEQPDRCESPAGK